MHEDSFITFSIIVPVWPNDKRPFCLDYIDALEFPTDRIEVLLSRGHSPCKQRNIAAEKASGDVLVFFDDDSSPDPDFFRRLEPYFDDKNVICVGGPNPGVVTDSFVPNLVEAVFHSRVGVFSKRNRYKSVGGVRQASDSDLIFCNCSVRKKIYQEIEGLNENLCPNEENEFFERLKKKYSSKKLLYAPDVIAREPRPDTIQFFLRKMFGYGKGRARQFRVKPSLLSAIHLLGGLLIFLPPLVVFLWDFWGLLLLFLPYSIALFIAAACHFVKSGKAGMSLALMPMIFATHIAYVLGMWKGLFEPLKRPSYDSTKVEVYKYNIEAKTISKAT